MDKAGEQRQACWKATRSAGVAEFWAYSAMAGVGLGLVGSGVGGLGGCMVVVQSAVSLLLVPVRMSSPFSHTSAVVAVKITLQPASQSWPIEIRLVLPRAGNRWAVVAVGGSCGISIWAVCVDFMVLPSGKETRMPLLVCRLFLWGALSERKWLVHPESNIACVFWGGEGPKDCD